MKSTLLLLLVALSAADIDAQAAPPTAYINDVWVEPIAQTGAITAISDLGFPIGKRAVQATLHCQPPGTTVAAYTPDGAGAYLPDPDPTALPAIAASRLVQTNSAAVQVKSIGGTLRLTCKDHVLYTDFSGAFGPGSRPDQDALGDGHLRVRRWPLSGTVDLTVPLFAQPGSDGQPEIFDFYLSLNAKTLATPQTINDIVLGAIGIDRHEGVFWLDTGRNILFPLKYDGNASGIATVRGMKTGDLMQIYYAPDYTVNTGWRELSIDFKSGLTWNVPASKPTDATFGR